MDINLNNLGGLPGHLINELSKHDKEFTNLRYLEHLEENQKIRNLIAKINEFCLQNEIVGFHYTRAYPEDILTKGLLVRSGDEIRAEFLKRHSNLFTRFEIEQIISAWNRSFDKHDKQYRDNRIFFNFTLSALNTSSSEPLLRNYGGEQVYQPIHEIEGIKEKLKKIGTPLIAKCCLTPNNLKTYIENPWGRIALSTYHRIKNGMANQTDQDGSQRIPVSPDNIELYKVDGSRNILKYSP